MLHGDATIIVTKEEMIHAMDSYFRDHVRDNGLRQYARVTDVKKNKDGHFEIELKGCVVEH